MNDQVIIVDKNDNEIGSKEKIETHRQGLLHRAFSIFIVNSKMEMLLQKRAKNKYHSGELWTNTCCSHPHPGEKTEAAAHKRLMEEMGFDCPLQEVFSFIYHTKLDDEEQLTEHEYDHVFIGKSDIIPTPNPKEVDDFKWAPIETVVSDIKKHPEKYSYWFKKSLEKVVTFLS